jgi:twitching motility protein PilJ
MRNEINKNNLAQQEGQQPILNTRLIIDNHNNLQEEPLDISSTLLDQERNKSLWQRFSNLSIRRKQFIAFISAEFISILGLSLGFQFLLKSNLQTLSIEQAKSELIVAEIAYNIKINQMGFGFRGQSDNAAIIKAAAIYDSGQSITSDLKAEVKQILQNETKARKIEYATLVGRDFKIIANANNDRQGQFFNPDGLVNEVFKYPRQIKANRIVKWSELSQETPLFSHFKNEDVLIRYTVTPISNPNTQAVVGALISGDIINGKSPIMKDYLKGDRGGYNAVYSRRNTGKFVLEQSLSQSNSQDISQVRTNIALPEESISLLAEAASDRNGLPVTRRIKIGDQFYTIAAKAVPDKIIETDEGQVPIFGNQATAILLRGTPEKALNELLEKSLWIQVLIVIIALAMILLLWAIILRRTIINPIEKLQQKAQQFAAGDRYARAEVFFTDEVGKLTSTFNEMADKLTQQAIQQENEVKAAQLVNEITSGCRGTLNTIYILNVVTTSTRDAIKADRVVVYRFNQDLTGKVVAESVSPDFPITFGTEIADICLTKKYLDKYQRGFCLKLEDIYEDGLPNTTINQLEQLAVKASLVVPILLNNNLYGFLIAQQCSKPRQWEDLEINLLKQLTIPVGYALEVESLLQHVNQIEAMAEKVVNEQYQQNEVSQGQMMKLLNQIQGIFRGDLTVRSEVTIEEFSTLADFFNAVVESFRTVVTKVKVSASNLNLVTVGNENLINSINETVVELGKLINQTQIGVGSMTLSMQKVAENAQKAASFIQAASEATSKTEATIEQNVQNIFMLRSTISNINNKVKAFENYLQEISQVINLINQIATQTKVLAVNSGLEAARQNNKENEGVAAIALEVNNLTVRYIQASEKIKEISENIQLQANEALTSLEQGSLQVAESSCIVEQTNIHLSQILDLSHQIDELVQLVSHTTISGIKTSHAVIQSMEDISQLSKLTYNSSCQISQSLQQTGEIYQQLQGTVENFKVS